MTISNGGFLVGENTNNGEDDALIKEFPANSQMIKDLSKHADLELQFVKGYEKTETLKAHS